MTKQAAENDDRPHPTDPGWEQYVLGMMNAQEVDPQGRPRVCGLVRVAWKVFGEPISSVSRVVEVPRYTHTSRGWQAVSPAVCEHAVTFLRDGREMIFQDVADAFVGNVVAFGEYATALAATRARGRAYRMALNLSVPAAEEVGLGLEGDVQSSRMDLIRMKCESLGIDLQKYLHMGKDNKFNSLEEVPDEVAAKMVSHLDAWGRNPGAIPDGVRSGRNGRKAKASVMAPVEEEG